mgnify:CR=1 FL=1
MSGFGNLTSVLKAEQELEDKEKNKIKNSYKNAILLYNEKAQKYNVKAENFVRKDSLPEKKSIIHNVDKHVDDCIDELYDEKFSQNQIKKMISQFKFTQDIHFTLNKILLYPFDYITNDYQLITFNKAEKICSDKNIIVEPIKIILLKILI